MFLLFFLKKYTVQPKYSQSTHTHPYKLTSADPRHLTVDENITYYRKHESNLELEELSKLL